MNFKEIYEKFTSARLGCEKSLAVSQEIERGYYQKIVDLVAEAIDRGQELETKLARTQELLDSTSALSDERAAELRKLQDGSELLTLQERYDALVKENLCIQRELLKERTGKQEAERKLANLKQGIEACHGLLDQSGYSRSSLEGRKVSLHTRIEIAMADLRRALWGRR